MNLPCQTNSCHDLFSLSLSFHMLILPFKLWMITKDRWTNINCNLFVKTRTGHYFFCNELFYLCNIQTEKVTRCPSFHNPQLSIFVNIYFFCWLCFLTATVITYIQCTGPFFFFCGSQQCCLTMHYPGFECRHRITLQSEANSNTLIVESVNEDAFRNASHTMGNVNISDVTQ